MSEKNYFSKAKRQVTVFKKYAYFEINEERSHIIVENVLFSIKNTIDGLEDGNLNMSQVLRLKREILSLLKVSEPHIYKITNFFEED